jgi:hypothetical protein
MRSSIRHPICPVMEGVVTGESSDRDADDMHVRVAIW